MTDNEKSLQDALRGMTQEIAVDRQLFDEMKIDTVPRYKSSQASGDEWRYSNRIRFYKKGILIKEEFASAGTRDVLSRIQNYYPDMYTEDIANKLAKLCQQEGCSRAAENYYKMKKRHCCHCGEASKHPLHPVFRAFCSDHSTRGDCSLEDCDSNYELIYGSGANAVPQEAVSRSVPIFVFATEN